MVVSFGSGERMAAVLREVGELLEHPLMTLERITVANATASASPSWPSFPRATSAASSCGRSSWSTRASRTASRIAPSTSS